MDTEKEEWKRSKRRMKKDTSSITDTLYLPLEVKEELPMAGTRPSLSEKDAHTDAEVFICDQLQWCSKGEIQNLIWMTQALQSSDRECTGPTPTSMQEDKTLSTQHHSLFHQTCLCMFLPNSYWVSLSWSRLISVLPAVFIKHLQVLPNSVLWVRMDITALHHSCICLDLQFIN